MFRDEIHSYLLRNRVRNTDFTIVASNCWGSRIYQDLGIPYNTPFAGLFLYAPCYIRLLGNLESYLNAPLEFAKKSKYDPDNTLKNGYPIGVLKRDVEIHFQHYKTREEARTKWKRRIKRMNMHNLYVAFTDRDECDESLLMAFDNMPYRKKVCFTAKSYPHIESALQLPEYRNEPHVGDIYTHHYVYKRHFDVADWLNGGTGRKTTLPRFLYRLLS